MDVMTPKPLEPSTVYLENYTNTTIGCIGGALLTSFHIWDDKASFI
jgi:hypothetical protein